MARILIRGVNEFGSAIAHQLWTKGLDVAIHDHPTPIDCHRWMAFTDAVFDGNATLDGVGACLVPDVTSLLTALRSREHVPIVTVPIEAIVPALQPDVLVDARMGKRDRAVPQRGMARLTIGLGPGFEAGVTTDLAIETGFGDDFGRVYERGSTRPLSGDPPPLLGFGRERFVYAPAAGLFCTSLDIGDSVEKGDRVATIDGEPLYAPVAGALRGLTHDGVPVTAGVRVIEVDPRGPSAVSRHIGTRQRQVADVVCATIAKWHGHE